VTLRILIVDDEPDAEALFRQRFRRRIRRGEYQLDFRASGAGALALLDAENPPGVALVLSDINMPGMTGIQLLEEIRKRWSDLPVCMITAYGDRATESKAHDMGASAFLSKPIDFDALEGRLADLVENGKA
jgi:DNA-binding NtrC family response regulator